MIATINNATIPYGGESVESEISNARTQDLKKTRVLFFAMDVITPDIKYKAPASKGFGGIDRSDLKTIQHNGNLGMIYKCKFTPMRTKMIDDNREMIKPADVSSWETSYTIENGRLNPRTGQWEDVVVGGTDTTAHLIYKARYPGQELHFALTRNAPNGEGGLVEITALKGSDYREQRKWQLFFFPEWAEVERGQASLPTTLSALERHLQSIDVNQSDDPVKAAAIRADMLKSCTEYRFWGISYLKFVEDAINEAKVKGQGYEYPALGLILLEQLEQKRKDDLVSGEFNSTQLLIEEMRAERANKDSLAQRELELRERELRIKEIELGLRKPDVMDTVPIATPQAIDLDTDENAPEDEVVETLPEVAYNICGKAKADGTPCQRELKEGEDACFQHRD